MDLFTAKIVALILMGGSSLAVGLLPLKVKPMILKGDENSRKRRGRERIISGLLCLGSGVLLATVFIHMLPETREGFDKAVKSGLINFPAENSMVHDRHTINGEDDSGMNRTNLHNHPKLQDHEGDLHDHNHSHDHDHHPDHNHHEHLNFASENAHHDSDHALPTEDVDTGSHVENNEQNPSKDVAATKGENVTEGDDSRFEPLVQDDHDHSSPSYPLAELIVCVGFFLIYLIEEGVHKMCLNHSDIGHHHHSHIVSGGRAPITKNGNNNNNVSFTQGVTSRPEVQGVDNPVFSGDVDTPVRDGKLRSALLSSSKVLPITAPEPRMSESNSHSRPPSAIPSEASTDSIKKEHLGTIIASNIRSFLLVLTVSFHDIFEGLAVGLQEKQEDVWYLFFAVVAHKYVIVFCIGLELMDEKTSRIQMVGSMILLGLVSSIGIGIGIVVTENFKFGGSEHVVVVSVLQGLAAGTLLYVAFLEVLEKERSKPGGRILKMFSMMFGFALMCSLEAIGGHSH